MDDRRSPLATLLAIPILAFFLGAGILATKMAMDWSPRQTDTVIGGGLAICGSGLAIFSLVVGSLVGIGIYRRITDRGQQQQEPAAPPAYYIQPPPGSYLPYREPSPPMIEASKQQGSWASNGPASYDIWQEEPEEASWSQGSGWS